MDRFHKANVTLLILAEETGTSLLSPKLWKSSDLNQLPVTAPFPGPSLLLLKNLNPGVRIWDYRSISCGFFSFCFQIIHFCCWSPASAQQLEKTDFSAPLVWHFKGWPAVLPFSQISFQFLCSTRSYEEWPLYARCPLMNKGFLTKPSLAQIGPVTTEKCTGKDISRFSLFLSHRPEADLPSFDS